MHDHIVWNDTVSEGDKAALGIRKRSRLRTKSGPPVTIPLLQVDSRIATHRIQFCDSEGPNTRARAKKTAYCELWYQVDGSPPAVPDDAPLRCNISRSGQQIIFDTAIKGKTVYYFARWVNSKGEHGPWSAMSSAIVI